MIEFQVLIVDDDDINRKLLHSILKKRLYRVKIFEATNGEEALNICYQERNLHVILLDIEMPIVDGIEFLNRYINKHNLKHTPVVAFSSNDLSKKDAFKAGAYDFIVKPITEEKLLSSILASSNL